MCYYGIQSLNGKLKYSLQKIKGPSESENGEIYVFIVDEERRALFEAEKVAEEEIVLNDEPKCDQILAHAKKPAH